MRTFGVRIGICSWTDRTLLRSGFYPAGCDTPARRLAFYASQFDTVEVDSTYYALPDPANAVKWIAGTPRGFRFGVKSYSVFTWHRTKFANLPDWLQGELGPRAKDERIRRDELTHGQRVRLFEDFIRPVRMLHDAGRLAYLLYQFPPGWAFRREGLVYFRRLREVSGPLPLAVEVRHKSWLEEDNRAVFLRALENENIAYTAVDEPALTWTVPPAWPVTAEWGTLVRFHGRNRAGWRDSAASVHKRFDYRYSRAELEEWLPRVEKAARHFARGTIYLMYNNCVEDKAVQAAMLIREMLKMDDPVPEAGRQKGLGL